MELFLRIKKYLFLLALVVSLTFGVHVAIVYLYDEAELIPERWGTFSIGVTGASPSLNPTQYGIESNNDFALRFLYRGLLRYDPEGKSMEWDLANCDISRNLWEVRCYFKTGSIWSDGSKMSVEDVLATYSLLAETDTNKKLQASLSKFAITREGSALVFRSGNPSVETLQLLTIPIIKKSVSERIRNEGIFKEEAYSGLYTFEKRESDPVRMSENISLVSNDTSGQSGGGYTKILIKVFGDAETLFAQKDSLNLVFPGYYEDVPVGDRFRKGEILTPDFAGAFLNSERLNPERRKLLSGILHTIVAGSNGQLRTIKNPFFTENTISQAFTWSVETELEKVWYFKKGRIPKPAESTKPPVPTPTETPPAATAISNNGATHLEEKKLAYFDTPGSLSEIAVKYTDELLLSGKVPNGVSAVYINGYKLRAYSAGMSRFSYRARTELGNLKKWTNSYVLAFEKSGKKEEQETITIYNGTDIPVESRTESGSSTPLGGTLLGSGSLAPSTSLVGSGSYSGSTTPSSQSPLNTSGTGESTETGLVSATAMTGILGTGTTATSSGTSTPPEKSVESEDTRLYYRNGNPVILTLRSLSPKEEISVVSQTVVQELEKIGFTVDFQELESSSASLNEIKEYETKKTYDIFITGVNLGYLGTYAMPYFHSGQAQNGFNFSLLRNPTLDILLEELRTKWTSAESRTRLFEKINDILRKEYILVPIGTSPLTYYIDKNIQEFSTPELLPSSVFMNIPILKSYINRTYIINFENKSVSGFTNWCKQILFSGS